MEGLLSSPFQNFFCFFVVIAEGGIALVEIMVSQVSAFDLEFFQTAIPHTPEDLEDVNGDEHQQISEPTDFDFLLDSSLLDFFQSVNAKGANPLCTCVVSANVIPIFLSDTLFHFDYLFRFVFFIIAWVGVFVNPFFNYFSWYLPAPSYQPVEAGLGVE